MPTYDYELLDKDGEPTGETFEIVQLMADEPLTTHPETGQACRRAISAPAIAGKWSDLNKTQMSNKRLGELGFTKFEKKGDGYYERTAGTEGPKTINADDLG